MNRPSNDSITKVFDWLYIGGVRNTRKTLPLVDVWYDFKWDTSQPKNLSVSEELIVHHKPFDDGDLKMAESIWRECRNEILNYKKQGKKIFVSCYEGVSRSAVLVLWLCCDEFDDYDLALKHLKTCRNIYPDKSFTPFLEFLQFLYAK